jgi:hypothetical protein
VNLGVLKRIIYGGLLHVVTPICRNGVASVDGFRGVKESTKPGLTEDMKKARLGFCKAHEHWTIEDWKKVIWTDETSVVLSHRRGKYRIRRRNYEKHFKTGIRSRFKKASEFMFWGAFS